MSEGPKVTIAGAGALGLTTALVLADAGCAVTVCDPGGPNASRVAAGMIAPLFEAVLDAEARPHLDLLLAARDRWPGLAVRGGVALDRSGAIAVGSDDWLGAVAAGFGAVGWRPSEISGATGRTLAPGLAPGFGRALLSREDWRVEPAAVLDALRAAAEGAGVAFRRGEVAVRGGEDVLVVATGAHRGLAEAAPELGHLSPIKGHIVRAVLAPPAVTVRCEGAYVVPGSGGVTVGATMEPGLDDTDIDPSKADRLMAAAAHVFPGLVGARTTIGAGVRAGTADGLPMVGWSRAPGVVLAVGARRNGWLLAPLVAQVVAACVTGRDPGPYAARLDPKRFGEGR